MTVVYIIGVAGLTRGPERREPFGRGRSHWHALAIRRGTSGSTSLESSRGVSGTFTRTLRPLADGVCVLCVTAFAYKT